MDYILENRSSQLVALRDGTIILPGKWRRLDALPALTVEQTRLLTITPVEGEVDNTLDGFSQVIADLTSPTPNPLQAAVAEGANRGMGRWFIAPNGIDDSVAFAAILAEIPAYGAVIEFSPGNYRLAPGITIPDYVTLRGSGKRATIIERIAAGNFMTLGSYCGIENLTIDGKTATHGAGKGVLIPSNEVSQTFISASITSFVEPCLEFAADGGSGFNSVACDYYTTGAVGTVAAVKVNGTDTEACPRQFIGTNSGGCTLFDFGGANDCFVWGGYTNGLIFGDASSKVLISNLRIGSAAGTVTIKGDNHKIKGCVFASAVILASGTAGIDLDSEVAGWSITDNGSGNYVTISGVVAYAPVWASTGSAPSLGNGTISAAYTRKGSIVTGWIELSFGSTTTPGTGVWTFTLPVADYASLVTVGGVGISQGTGSGPDFMFTTRAGIGDGLLSAFFVDTSGALQNLTGTTKSWANTSVFRFGFEYIAR